MPVTYRRIPPDELRRRLRGGGVVIMAVWKKGRESKMPRLPGRKTALDIAMLDAVSGDGKRCKLADDHGSTVWVDCDDLLFSVDEL